MGRTRTDGKGAIS